MNLVKLSLLPRLSLLKSKVTSGASRAASFYKNELPLQLKHKKLLNRYKWNSGRSSTGRVVVWTKAKRTTKHRLPAINYKFRQTDLGFIGGLLLRPLLNKLVALLFMSSGSVTYVPTSTKHTMFQITQLKSVFSRKNPTIEQLKFTNPSIIISATFFLIKQLPKNQPVSLLEILPGSGIQYSRSTGTSARIVKMDSRVSTSLIKLPSGVKKVFSTYSIGSVGSVSLPENKKWGNNSAGFYKKFGKKSKVRGVAMNPVDHPHGGRAKAIRYQRTPWGKTTKYK
jgi:large subunit ribosomal protein L2